MLNDMFQNRWTEFQWEDAFRQDSERITAYMSDLPMFMDIPGEEEVMLNRLRNRHKLTIPEFPWTESEEEEDDDETAEFSDDPNVEPLAYSDWMIRDGAPILQTLGNLSRAFGRLFALALAPENRIDGIAILCQYGKILACYGDIVEEPSDEYPALRAALAKRGRTYISDLIKMLESLEKKQPEFTSVILNHTMVLREQCEKTAVLIYKFRDDARQKMSGD